MKLIDNLNFYVFKRKGYVIRKSWGNTRCQIGSVFNNRYEAVANCPNTYSVFNAKGRCVYDINGYEIRLSKNSPLIAYFDTLIDAIIHCPKNCNVYRVRNQQLVFDSRHFEYKLREFFDKKSDEDDKKYKNIEDLFISIF